MADNVDRRVIQLSFENQQFERNIAKSKKSIDELKQAMDFEQTSRGMSRFTEGMNSLRFDKLETNIQKLTDKFTGLGTVTELVVSQVRRGIEQMAARVSGFIDSMTTAQIHAGMEKYDMLNNSVQTIKAATGKDEKEVYEVMERLNRYTDETSYNFADMAQNIGKFTSVGIDLWTAEHQMEGIANWAARSGAGINEASRAMYNLSQAMGVGKLTLIDWKSIENAGMATREFKQQLIDSAVAAKTLEKTVDKKTGNVVYKTAKSLGKQVEVTVDNVGSTLNKAWATKDVLGNTLNKYYWESLSDYDNAKPIIELGEEQKAAFEKVFADDDKISTHEWKSLESLGILTEENKKKLVDLAVSSHKLTKEVDKDGKTIYKAVDKNGKEIKFTFDELERSLGAGWFDKDLADTATSINDLGKSSFEAAQKCLKFSDVLGAWRDQISTGWMNTWKKIFGDLSVAMEFFSEVCNKVAEPLGNLIKIRNDALDSWVTGGGRDSFMSIILGSSWKNANADAVGFIDMLTGIGNMVYTGFRDFFLLFADPADQYAAEQDPEYFSAWLGARLADITEGVQGFMQRIKGFFSEEIDVGGESKSRLEVIYDIVKGISGALGFAYMILEGAAHFMAEVGTQLKPGFDTIIGFFSELGTRIFDTAQDAAQQKTIFNFFDELAKKAEPVTSGINKIIGSLDRLLRVLLGMDKKNDGVSTIQSFGETLLRVADIVGRVVGPILSFIADFISLLADLASGKIDVKGFLEGLKNSFSVTLSSMPQSIQNFVNFFKDAWGNLKTLFEGGISTEKIKAFGSQLKGSFDKMLSGVSPSVQKVVDFFKGAWEKLKGLFSPKEGQNGSSGILGIFDNTKNFFSSIEGKSKEGQAETKKATKTFAEWLSSLDWSKILLILGSVAGISVTILIILKIINLVKKFMGTLGDLVGILKDGIKLKFNNEPEKAKSFAEKMLILAAAVAIITACLYTIGNMPFDKALQGIIGIGLILVGVAAFFKIMAKTFTDEKSGMKATDALAMSVSIIAIAAAISIIVKALLPISNLNLDQFLTMFGGFGAILMWLAMFMSYVKMVDPDPKSLYGVTALAAAIAILVFSLVPLAQLPKDKLEQALIALALLMVELGVFIAATKKISMAGSGMTQLVALAGAVAILALSLVPLALIPWDRLKQALGSVGIILAMLVVFMMVTKKLSAEGAGLTQLVGLAAAVALLALSLVPLSLIPFERILNGIKAIGLILVELALFMFATKKLTMSGSSMTQLIALAGAVMMLSLMLIPLALLPFDKLMGAVLAVGIIIAALAGVMWLIGSQKISMKGSGIVGLIAIAGAIAILMFALIPLAFLNPQELTHIVIGIVVVIGMLALLVFTVSKVDWAGALSATVMMLSIMGVLLVLGDVLLKIKDVPVENLKAFMLGFAALIVGVAAAAALAKFAGITGIGLLILGIAGLIAAILGVVALLGPTAAGSIAEMGASLTLFSGLMETFSQRMDNVSESGIQKAGRIIDLLSSIILKMGAFVFGAALSHNLTESISYLLIFADLAGDFSSRMTKVKVESIIKAGSFIDELNKIFGGLGEFKSDSFGEVTDAISYLLIFADLAGDFATEMSDVTLSSVKNAKTFVTGMKGILEEAEGFTYSSNMDSFTTAIWDLGTTAAIFASDTSDIGDVSENGAIKLIKELSACANDLKTIEQLNIDTLTAQLTGLGGAMMIYAKGTEEATGIETGEGAPDVAGAVRLLSDISTALSENGGFTIPSNMPDETALGNFGAQLAALAGALVMFEEAGSGLGDGTQQALKTLDFFRELKTKLIEIDLGANLASALLSFGEGENAIQPNELETFGKNIEQLGLALAKFAESTTVIDSATGEMKPIDYTKATEALTSMSSLTENLPTLGGITSWVTGQKESLTQFAADIQELGSALATFSKKVTGQEGEGEYQGIDVALINDGKTGATTVVDKAVEVIGELVSVRGKLAEITGDGGITSIWSGTKLNFTTFGEELQTLGSGLKTFAQKVTGQTDSDYAGIDMAMSTDANGNPSFTVVEKAVEIVNSLVEAKGKLPKGGFSLATFWGGEAPSFTKLGGELEGLGQGLKDFSDKVLATGENGGTFNAEQAKEAVGVVTSIADVMNELAAKLPKVGGASNIASSIANGRSVSLTDVGKQLSGLGGDLGSFSQAITGKFTNNRADIDNAIHAVDGIVDLMTSVASMSTLGFYAGDVSTWTNDLKTFLSSMTAVDNENDMSAADRLVDLMRQISASMDIAEGLETSNIQIFSSFADALSKLAAVDFDQIKRNFEVVGSNIAAGVKTGIDNGTSGVINAAVAMAVSAYEAAKAALDIQSPSKKFAEIGNYAGEGLAKGIIGSTSSVTDATEGMSQEALDNASNIMGLISQLMTEGLDTTPTISPVLDLSQAEMSMNEFRNNLSNNPVGINTSYAANRAGRIGEGTNVEAAQNGSDYSGIYERMAQLGEQIQGMNTAISNMKLVLDTGVVAGGVTNGVDRNIGRKRFYSNRNN